MLHGKTGHKIVFVEPGEARRTAIAEIWRRLDTTVELVFTATSDDALAYVRREKADALFVPAGRCDGGIRSFVGKVRTSGHPAPVIALLPAADEATELCALSDGAHACAGTGPADIAGYPGITRRAEARFTAERAEADLALTVLRSQEQWMAIFDAITDYLFVLDSAKTLVKVNLSFSAAIGRHPRDIVGRRVTDVFNLDDPNDVMLQSVVNDGVPRTYEKKIGDEMYQISIFPLRDEGRMLTVHVMKNITEVRRLKDQLYHADKLASIGLLVSGVAHEINNPLTGTIAYTELLDMKITDESVKADLKKILDSAERCKKIVDNLLTFSRQRTPSKSLESVNDIIDRAVDLRNYWLRKNNIRITRDFDPVSTVFVDSQQIQQVVLNLLMNAEQAITACGQTRGEVSFTTRYDRSRRLVSIRVADNGPGIPERIATRIFDPFFTTKPVGTGTGLGLSIAHGIITEHGGTIRLAESAGNGAVFEIDLPTGTSALEGEPPVRESEQVS